MSHIDKTPRVEASASPYKITKHFRAKNSLGIKTMGQSTPITTPAPAI